MPQSRSLQLTHLLNLQAHPEGGWFREFYRSTDRVVTRSGANRCAVTSIYYLLTAGTFSRWHRVLSDEVWQHVEGGPMELFMFSPDFNNLQRVVLGPLRGGEVSGEGFSGGSTMEKEFEGQKPMFVVPARWWQACRPMGEYGLASCTVAPGFEFDDFAFLSDENPEGERLAQLDSAFLELL